ncbi:hypothetical protein V8G54_003048 [Vigna mungo]|uniref:Uncharacterized protein n=1 Tax=Vigna mungo TaxID=3915 RepID=A0AAQ3S9T0_VIGMU
MCNIYTHISTILFAIFLLEEILNICCIHGLTRLRPDPKLAKFWPVIKDLPEHRKCKTWPMHRHFCSNLAGKKYQRINLSLTCVNSIFLAQNKENIKWGLVLYRGIFCNSVLPFFVKCVI